MGVGPVVAVQLVSQRPEIAFEVHHRLRLVALLLHPAGRSPQNDFLRELVVGHDARGATVVADDERDIVKRRFQLAVFVPMKQLLPLGVNFDVVDRLRGSGLGRQVQKIVEARRGDRHRDRRVEVVVVVLEVHFGNHPVCGCRLDQSCHANRRLRPLEGFPDAGGVLGVELGRLLGPFAPAVEALIRSLELVMQRRADREPVVAVFHPVFGQFGKDALDLAVLKLHRRTDDDRHQVVVILVVRVAMGHLVDAPCGHGGAGHDGSDPETD